MKTDIPCDVLKREYQVTEVLTLVVAEKKPARAQHIVVLNKEETKQALLASDWTLG